MTLTSPAFTNGANIPAKYTCDGADISPELQIADVPPAAVNLALIVDDPDSPSGEFTHWLVWNIPPTFIKIPEAIGATDWPVGVVEGTNDFPQTGWGGPCPGKGKHHYRFTLYALNTQLDLPPTTTKTELLAAISKQVVEQCELIGVYERSR